MECYYHFFRFKLQTCIGFFFIFDKSWKILEQIFYQKLKITIKAWNFEFIFVSNKILSKTISFMIDFQPPKIVIHLFESFHNFWTIIMELFLYYFFMLDNWTEMRHFSSWFEPHFYMSQTSWEIYMFLLEFSLHFSHLGNSDFSKSTSCTWQTNH